MESNWLLAFLFGNCVALIGFMARLTLRESAEYANAKKRVKLTFIANCHNGIPKNNYLLNEKVNIRTLVAYLVMYSVSPICFYINYIYCGNILKSNFGYTSDQVISHNLILGIVNFINAIILTILFYKVRPLKILRIKFFPCFYVVLLSLLIHQYLYNFQCLKDLLVLLLLFLNLLCMLLLHLV